MLRLAALLMLVATAALATDNGQYEGVDPQIRAWFKSIKSKKGVPCCDISDGHTTTWRSKGAGYEVPIEGEWVPIPEEAIVWEAGNPTGEAVVWYVKYDSKVYVRCFVPSGGV
jgi:hypothetical protein